MQQYKLVNSRPVARFHYKGSHSHPIARTVLITEADEDRIVGYEVRAGKIIRQPNSAPVKSYLRRKIARIEQMRVSHKRDHLIISKGPKVSTLKRAPLSNYLFEGP